MLEGFAAYPPLTRKAGHRDKEQQYKGSGRLAADDHGRADKTGHTGLVGVPNSIVSCQEMPHPIGHRSLSCHDARHQPPAHL